MTLKEQLEQATTQIETLTETISKLDTELRIAEKSITALQAVIAEKSIPLATAAVAASLPFLQDMFGKANLKMKMSKDAQQWLFKNNAQWYVNPTTIQHLDCPYLYVNKSGRLTKGSSTSYYATSTHLEVQFDYSRELIHP